MDCGIFSPVPAPDTFDNARMEQLKIADDNNFDGDDSIGIPASSPISSLPAIPYNPLLKKALEAFITGASMRFRPSIVAAFGGPQMTAGKWTGKLAIVVVVEKKGVFNPGSEVDACGEELQRFYMGFPVDVVEGHFNIFGSDGDPCAGHYCLQAFDKHGNGIISGLGVSYGDRVIVCNVGEESYVTKTAMRANNSKEASVYVASVKSEPVAVDAKEVEVFPEAEIRNKNVKTARFLGQSREVPIYVNAYPSRMRAHGIYNPILVDGDRSRKDGASVVMIDGKAAGIVCGELMLETYKWFFNVAFPMEPALKLLGKNATSVWVSK